MAFLAPNNVQELKITLKLKLKHLINKCIFNSPVKKRGEERIGREKVCTSYTFLQTTTNILHYQWQTKDKKLHSFQPFFIHTQHLMNKSTFSIRFSSFQHFFSTFYVKFANRGTKVHSTRYFQFLSRYKNSTVQNGTKYGTVLA